MLSTPSHIEGGVRDGLASLLIAIAYLFFLGIGANQHPGLLTIIFGPAAVVISAAFAGVAATKGSRWWLAALAAPWLASLFIAVFLGTAHV